MGKQVLFVSMTPESGCAHWNMALEWLRTNGFRDYLGCEVRPHENIVRMGAGRVLFSMGKSISGPRLHDIQCIVEDHFVLECEAEAIKKARRDDAATIKALMLKHKWYAVKIPGTFSSGTTLLIRD